MPNLSIIIVSYNTKKVLKDCLSSLYKNTKELDFEVIVIDNASSDGSVTMIKKNFPKVRLILNKQNQGFGGANNAAAKLAKADYLLFLNSDTLISDNAITNTYNQALTTKNLGAISCQLLNKDASIQASGGFFPNLINVFTWQSGLDDLPILGDLLGLLIKPVHPQISFYKKNPKKLDWITGAFMIIPKKIYKKTGGFDESIFMYAEELELCFRIKKQNKKIYYFPESSIIHLGGQSAGQ